MKKSEVANFVKSIKKGQFVQIEFIKSNGELRKATAQFGVSNPKNVTKPGQGDRIGVSFDDALKNGVIKFYEPLKDGGVYRSATIERLRSITSNGVKYTITD